MLLGVTSDSVREVLTSDELVAGLPLGVAALAAGVVIGALWRWRAHRPAPVAGALAGAAAWLALDAEFGLPEDLLVVLVVLAAGGVIGDVLGRGRAVRLALAVPGAVLFATRIETPSPGWYPGLAAVVIAVAGSLVADLDHRRPGEALGPPLLGLSTIGVLATVPDTEHTLVLVGATALVALLGWPVALARLDGTGTLVAVALVAWVTGMDGFARQGSLVGALGSVALLAVPSLAIALGGLLRRGPRPWGSRWAWEGAVVGVHAGAVLVASRLGGLREDPGQAAVVVGAALALALVAQVSLDGGRRPPRRRPGGPGEPAARPAYPARPGGGTMAG